MAASLEPMDFEYGFIGRGGGGPIAVDGRLEYFFELEKDVYTWEVLLAAIIGDPL